MTKLAPSPFYLLSSGPGSWGTGADHLFWPNLHVLLQSQSRCVPIGHDFELRYILSIKGKMLGFLPLYLRGLGWEPAAADSTLASFHAVSMFFAIPIALLSDRIRSRRGVLMATALLIGIGTSLLGIASGVLISLAVLMAGISRDGFMALTMTTIIEEKGIGARFAGTAIGLNMSVMGIAGVFSPPVGNWLVKVGTGIPFLFWASFVLLGFVGYFFMQRTTSEL